MERKTFKLDNGLTVKFVARSGYCSSVLSVNVGHVNEPKLGLAALFEQVVLLQVSGILPVFGGTMTAYTAVSDSVESVFMRLSAIFSSEITEDYVFEAQERICRTTRENAQIPMRQLKLLYKHVAFGADLVRPEKEYLSKVRSYTVKDVEAFRDEYYTAKNMVLVVATSEASEYQVEALAKTYFGEIASGESKSVVKGSIYTGGCGAIKVVDSDVNMMFGWDMSSLKIEDSPAANVLMSLMLNRLSSEFVKTIPKSRVKSELKIAGYYGLRTLRIYASSLFGPGKKMGDAVINTINTLCDRPPRIDEMESGRNCAMAEKLYKFERTDNVALEIAWQQIGRGNMYDITNRINLIYDVEPDEVQDLARRIFRGSKMTYVAMLDPKMALYSYEEMMKGIKCEHLL